MREIETDRGSKVQENSPLKLLKSLSLLAVLGACAVANASSITMNLVNATSSAGTLTGTVEIDSSTNLVTAAHLSLNGNPVFTTISSESTQNGIGRAFISTSGTSPQAGDGEVALYYDLTALNNGGGILPLCLLQVDCGDRGNVASYIHLVGSNGTNGPAYLTSGELDPATAPVSTPEPSTLVLLGTGILMSAALVARMSGRRTEAQPVEPAQ